MPNGTGDLHWTAWRHHRRSARYTLAAGQQAAPRCLKYSDFSDDGEKAEIENAPNFAVSFRERRCNGQGIGSEIAGAVSGGSIWNMEKLSDDLLRVTISGGFQIDIKGVKKEYPYFPRDTIQAVFYTNRGLSLHFMEDHTLTIRTTTPTITITPYRRGPGLWTALLHRGNKTPSTDKTTGELTGEEKR